MRSRSADSLALWDSYTHGYNLRRTVLEIFIPFSLSVVSIMLSILTFTSYSDLLLRLVEINSSFFNIIAIQIGFNITSLALISSFNKETLRKVFSTLGESEQKERALKQLLASFIYCVFIQSSIIIIGLFLNLNSHEIINIDYFLKIPKIIKGLLYYPFYSIWLFVVFHTFMVSIRNIILIYKFILVTLKN